MSKKGQAQRNRSHAEQRGCANYDHPLQKTDSLTQLIYGMTGHGSSLSGQARSGFSCSKSRPARTRRESARFSLLHIRLLRKRLDSQATNPRRIGLKSRTRRWPSTDTLSPVVARRPAAGRRRARRRSSASVLPARQRHRFRKAHGVTRKRRRRTPSPKGVTCGDSRSNSSRIGPTSSSCSTFSRVTMPVTLPYSSRSMARWTRRALEFDEERVKSRSVSGKEKGISRAIFRKSGREPFEVPMRNRSLT